MKREKRRGEGQQVKKIKAAAGDARRDDKRECPGDHQGDAVQYARD